LGSPTRRHFCFGNGDGEEDVNLTEGGMSRERDATLRFFETLESET